MKNKGRIYNDIRGHVEDYNNKKVTLYALLSDIIHNVDYSVRYAWQYHKYQEELANVFKDLENENNKEKRILL
jgi:hypothetical protein